MILDGKQTFWRGELLMHLTNVRLMASELIDAIEEGDKAPAFLRRKAHEITADASGAKCAAYVFEALLEKRED